MRFFRFLFILSNLLLLLIFSTELCKAQDDVEVLTDITKHWEINGTIGANEFFGDLGGNNGIGKPFIKDYTFKTVRPLVGLSASYHVKKWLAVNGGFNFTIVSAADSILPANSSGDERWRWYRNLSFRSKILEGYVSGTIYPVMMFTKDRELHAFEPFVGFGIGVFHFNPQTQYDGSWVDLKPLRLEGEGMKEYPNSKPYKLTQFYIPIDIGLKCYINNTFAISGGFTFRHTFTDYIDDVHGAYVDPAVFDEYLSPDQANLAKQLYSRSLTPWKVKPGVDRSSNKANDTYVNFFLTLHIRLDRGNYFYYGVGG
jgi:hypothetical protein